MKVCHRVLSTLIILFAVLNLTVLAIRINSVVVDGQWGETTGIEYATLNAIYNVRRGLPCYHDLDQNASIPVYNYGFYSFYGLLARLANIGDDQFMTFVRFLTLGFCISGCLVMAIWIRKTIPNWRMSRILGVILALSVSINIFFGPFVGWFNLSARADILVILAELSGFTIAIIALNQGKLLLFLCSTVIFFLAWSFKQNTIFVFSGVLVLTLMLRRWLFFVLGSLTFMSFVILIVILAGPFYIKHVFQIVQFVEYSLTNIIRELPSAFLTGFYLFIPAIYIGYLLLVKGERKDSVFLIPWLFGGLGAIYCLGGSGASRNQLLTFYVIGGSVIIYGISKMLKGEVHFQNKLAGVISLILIVALGTVLTLSYLIFPNRFGRITVPVFPGVSPAQRDLHLSAPNPKFIENSFGALPWNSGQTPSEAISNYYYFDLVKKGIFKQTIEDRAKCGYYASAFVSDPNFVKAFRSKEYDLVSLLPSGVLYFKRTESSHAE
jgi:hypothetical protein